MNIGGEWLPLTDLLYKRMNPESLEQVRLSTNESNTDLITQIGHFATAEKTEDLDFTEESYKVTPQQRSYAALRVRGFSSAAASRQLNVNQMAASRWQNSKWFEPLCEEERNKWFVSSGVDVRKEIMAPLVSKAVDALSDALESEDDKVKILAANTVFDTFFANDKRPVGRPPNHKPLEEEPLTLNDLINRANSRVNGMTGEIYGQNEPISIRANGIG